MVYNHWFRLYSHMAVVRKEKRKGKHKMKSFSKIAFSVAVVLLASVASAGTLYWQVDDSSGADGALFWVADTNSSDKWALSADGSFKADPDSVFNTPTGIMQADISNYTGDQYRFYVELINYSTPDATTTEGYKWNYQELLTAGYVSFGATDFPTVQAKALAHSNFAVAPEPSSGLLLLMGGAMLALRRRRQK